MPLNETSSNTTVQYTVTTTNTADGTTLYWKTTGNVSNSDIVGGNTGSIVVTNNQAIFNVTVIVDTFTEGTETIGIAISTGSLNGPTVVSTANPITINDTSLSPQFNLYVWGENNLGQLGLNDTVYKSSPVQVGSGTSWSMASFGYRTTAAIKTTGTLWTWGKNTQGQLGSNDTTFRSSPVQVGSGTNWSKVIARGFHTLSIKTDGTLWSWGRGLFGALGLNNSEYISSPTQVGSETEWSQVKSDSFASMGLKTNGTLWLWGSNSYGQLGFNNRVYKSSPTQLGTGTDWSQVDMGQYGGMAIKTNGTLWLWGGRNNYGTLGLNDRVGRSSPVQLGALTNWSKVAIGFANEHAFAIKTDGTLWAWGNNNNGQLGQNDTVLRSSPVQVGSATNWSLISAGRVMGVAAKTDGTLWTWGRNNHGQMGINNIVYTSSPVQVGTATSWTLISSGNYGVAAISTT